MNKKIKIGIIGLMLLMLVGVVTSATLNSKEEVTISIDKDVKEFYKTDKAIIEKIEEIGTNEMLMEQIRIAHDMVNAQSKDYATIKAYNDYCMEYKIKK